MLSSYCYFFSSHSLSSPVDPEPASSTPRDRRPLHTFAEAAQSSDADSKRSSRTWADADKYIRSTVSDISASLNSRLESVSSYLCDASLPSHNVLSNLSLPSVSSWFAPSSSEPAQSKLPSAPVQSPARSPRPLLQPQQPQEESELTKGKTTFTFVLFGAASSAAVYLLVRNRRTMNRLQAAKSLAYRDARAWRRVALDFARINALAAGRVQNIVAASLRDGQAGKDIGRQIERELQEASRAVAQRRNWIREQDAKEASVADSSSHGSLAEVWGDIFDLERSGFFFGSRTGRRSAEDASFGTWQPGRMSRHDDVSRASSDRNACQSSEGSTSSNATSHEPHAAEEAPAQRSAKLKWQTVAGRAAAAAESSAVDEAAHTLVAKDQASSAETEETGELREEWIGDVDRAMRERDLKCSQEHKHDLDNAVESEDHLLPVSDLYIATDGRMRDEPNGAIIASELRAEQPKGQDGARPSRMQVESSDVYAYPISNQFRDLEDIFMASWDDSFAGLTSPATESSVKEKLVAKAVKARPNSALFKKLRAARAATGKEANVQSADDIEFLAELMFPQSAPPVHPAQQRQPDADGKTAPTSPAAVASPAAATLSETASASEVRVHELTEQLTKRQSELEEHKNKVRQLSERVDVMRDMCHELTDEAQRRDKTHKIQIEQLEHKIGLLTVWADEVQRRLGLDAPPFFAALRKPLTRRD